jgi:tetratricopeptide (TPR) repeat protein
MVLRVRWLCLACFVVGARAGAADLPALPESPVGIDTSPLATADAPHDLVMAASCIERGQDAAAITYLARYLAANPDRVPVRAYLAELLFRRDRFAEARAEFQLFVSDAQLGGVEANRLVHAHTRLMAIAARAGEAYAEHLHRGIALYLLACQQMSDESVAESTLCKAAGELTLAKNAKPDAARAHWYLHLVWTRLGQTQPAARSLTAASERRLLSDLSPAERRKLTLAAAPRR